jgi:hypothetical protein
MFVLLVSRNYSVGFDIFAVSENVPNCPGSFTKKSSGDFRWTFSDLACLQFS